MTTRFTTEYCDLGDCRIAFWDVGARDGVTVVFLHGIGGSKAVWAPVLEQLPDRWRLLACDYRGGGESEEEAPSELSLDVWASDLRKLLELRAVTGPVVVAGHSLGASIALQFALKWPDVPSALVLVGAEAGLCRLGAIMQERADGIRKAGMDGWIQGAWRSAPPFSEASLHAHPELLDEYAKMLYQTGANRYLRAVTAIAESPDLTDTLERIPRPALVLIGGCDDRTIPSMGWALAKGLPQGHGIEIPDVGHTLSYEAPLRVAGELTSFVSTYVSN